MAPLAVTSWSAVSAFGIGASDFGAGIRSGPRDAPAGQVPGFDVREVLGRKKTRSMDRVTGLTVVAVGRLLAGERAAGHEFDGDDTGLVIGTTNGSVQSMMDFSRDSFTQAKPHLVDPARFPNAVMNRAAGQSAIWHGLRGPNTTVASGQVAGLSALGYGARLHHCGHARSVLCGAAEELTPARIRLEDWRGDDERPVLGEGAAVVRLESTVDAARGGRPALACLVGTAFRVHAGPADVPATLADCARSVLKSAGGTGEDVWALAADLTDAQHAGLTEAIGDRPLRIGLAGVLGDTGAASAALQVAAVLALADADPAARGRLALVASVDRDGSAGVAAFRLPGRRQGWHG